MKTIILKLDKRRKKVLNFVLNVSFFFDMVMAEI